MKTEISYCSYNYDMIWLYFAVVTTNWHVQEIMSDVMTVVIIVLCT